MPDNEKKEGVRGSLEGSHYGYCHFTYKNRYRTWRCCCEVIKGYLEWVEERKKFKLEYTDNEVGSP